MAREKVAIVYKSLPQYRRRFFELLRERLDQHGIDLMLIYGQAGAVDSTKLDGVDIPWAHRIQNRILRLGAKEIYWQPCLNLIKDADLVIVEQASKLIVNYILLAQHALGIRKLALWGHGKNLQATAKNSLAEAVKRYVSRNVHWWFAYNELSARIVTALGFPAARVTLVQNAIDTRELASSRTQIPSSELKALRDSTGIRGDNVAIFCGAMYQEKLLDFLMEACTLIRMDVPDFEVIFLGAGPDQHKVEAAAQQHSWIHYVGAKFDRDKVPYFSLSKLYLMPGLVGLGILDSFALQTPLVTTRLPYHSPEIDYLRHGHNGWMTDPDSREYAKAVTRLLQDDDIRSDLVRGCQEAAARYTVEAMVDNFATGVLKALERG